VGANTTFDTPQGLVDADGDGVPPPADCNDADPRIRPGATDTPGDKIDQDCSGRDAPFPVLAELTTYAYRNAGSAKLLTSLQLTRLAGGETAVVTCTGGRRRGCSFKTKRYTKLKPGKRSLTRLFRGRSLRSGAVVAVLVTKPATVGSALTLKFRGRRAPRVTRACLPPGAKRPQRCG
jgi:hypothetical protein